MVLRKIKMRPVEDHPIELLPALISRAEFGIEMHMELRN